MSVTAKTIAWDDATLEELKIFARNSMGMHTMAGNIGEAALRAKLRVAYSGETITILVEDSPVDKTKGAIRDKTGDKRAMAGASTTEDPLVWVTVAAQEGEGGHRNVYVNNNGVAFLIPRGKSVPIPYRYYLVMKDAVRTDYHQDLETDEMVSIDVFQYPFSVDKPAPEEAVKAWHLRDQAA